MEPGLKIISSNRLEILVAQLAEAVRIPLSSPLAPEVIVVQSSGMQRWVAMALAAHNGICANVVFPFPNRFLHDIFKRVLPDIPERSFFEPRTLAFAIMRQLPQCTARPGFEELQRYLATDPSDLKLLQLSEKIADLFDQYLVFRPDSIAAWEAGKAASDPATHWQAHLWRSLAAGREADHRAALHRTLIEALRSPAGPPPDLPERISIFGIAYLPRFYLQAIAEIARRVPVFLFLLNPCREYWADILSEQDKRRVATRNADMAGGQADLLHLDPGHRLLASLGTLGRDFFAQLVELDADYREYFENPVPSDILSSLQADIFNLHDRAAAGLQGSIAPQDRSIQIHSCHGPMREVEVLHDNLLAMLEASPNLAPGDIIVMAPDVEDYAPCIRAVFDAHADHGLRIPYSIADQSARRESRLIDAFFALLDMPRGRFNAPEVLALLECHGIQQTFDWTPHDASTAARWIRETRIRWGIDATWRQRIGLPPYEDNSWQSGLQRLLLGYAMPGNGRETFGGILPYDNIEGGETPTLGKLLRFVEKLFPLFDNLKSNVNLECWKVFLDLIFENFFTETAETQRELLALRHAVDALAAQQAAAAYAGEVSVEVVRHFLEQYFREEGGAGGFITGGVTFCSLLPMRSIPFQIVCLLGMNADAFPREAMHPSFDLIVRHPRAGDRSRRNDDKYLFLEALISARQKLYISYVGQNLQDNAPAPPSVIVSELLDYLTQGYGVEAAQIVTAHKLQAFAPDYFKDESAVDDRLFSYSDENLLAAERLLDGPTPTVFFDAPLAEPGTALKNLTLQQLCAFYAHPVRFLLQRRLGVFQEDATLLVDERENFTLHGLERYLLEQDLVGGHLAGTDGGVLFALEKAAGRLSPGTVGQVVYGDLSADADSFARRVRSYCGSACATTIDLRLTVDDFTLSGPIAGLHAGELIRFRYARLKPSDLLTTWILHLARSVGFPADPGNRSLLLVKNGLWAFEPLPNSRELLQGLLNLYWQGMRAPLAFFPAAALAYARQVFIAGKTREAGLQSAEKTWQGGEFSRGESEDPYFNLCFAPPAPLGETFCQLAEAVFAPLLQAATETPV